MSGHIDTRNHLRQPKLKECKMDPSVGGWWWTNGSLVVPEVHNPKDETYVHTDKTPGCPPATGDREDEWTPLGDRRRGRTRRTTRRWTSIPVLPTLNRRISKMVPYRNGDRWVPTTRVYGQQGRSRYLGESIPTTRALRPKKLVYLRSERILM